MDKYFELRENGDLLYGVVSNIPEETDLEKVKERMEIKTEKSELILVDSIFKSPDIVMDWTTLDYEQELDEDYINLSDSLVIAIENGVETEVIYTAMNELKKNPELSISEIILTALKEWTK